MATESEEVDVEAVWEVFEDLPGDACSYVRASLHEYFRDTDRRDAWDTAVRVGDAKSFILVSSLQHTHDGEVACPRVVLEERQRTLNRCCCVAHHGRRNNVLSVDSLCEVQQRLVGYQSTFGAAVVEDKVVASVPGCPVGADVVSVLNALGQGQDEMNIRAENGVLSSARRNKCSSPPSNTSRTETKPWTPGTSGVCSMCRRMLSCRSRRRMYE